MNDTQQPLTQSLPPKKQPRDIFLEARCWHLLNVLDLISDPKERERATRRLNSLVRELRGMAGKSRWPLAWAAIGCAGFVLWLKPWTKSYFYSASDPDFPVQVRVIEKLNDYDFTLQFVHAGKAEEPFFMRFCKDYRPQFQTGFTLTRLAYDDRGSCAELKPKDRGYAILRGPDGWPKIPKNCTNPADKDSFCIGKPQFD
jgi:hypothetical protein